MSILCKPTPDLNKEGWDKLLSLSNKELSEDRKDAIKAIHDREKQ